MYEKYFKNLGISCSTKHTETFAFILSPSHVTISNKITVSNFAVRPIELNYLSFLSVVSSTELYAGQY